MIASTAMQEANPATSTEDIKFADKPENLDFHGYAKKITDWVYSHPREAATMGLGGLLLLNPGSLAATIRKEITPALRNSFLDFAQGAGKSNEGTPIEHGAMATGSQEAIASKLGAFSDPEGSVENEAKTETAVWEDVHRAISKGEDDESKAKGKKVIKDGK
ncbi:MAG: hypothetical protein Q9183_006100, partial [Haloplaca sp. 2 TL-2023]